MMCLKQLLTAHHLVKLHNGNRNAHNESVEIIRAETNIPNIRIFVRND